MKNVVGELDAIPSKRLFQSIIADYDLNRSVCELVDNALDVWVRSGKSKPLHINITLNIGQQTITVDDDAGGLSVSELRFIVAPGQTGTNPTDKTIGIFGVGTKRAVVALAMDITLTTRYPKELTYQLEFDDKWINDDDDWKLLIYEVDNISEGTTIIELKKLREQLTDEICGNLKDAIKSTYAKFLNGPSVSI